MTRLVFTIGQWQPQIGDPSFAGWLTVGSYYFCAGLSLLQTRIGRRQMEQAERRLRIFLTLAVFALGLAKQFNLPGAVTELGRLVVDQFGGYEGRRGLQTALMVLVGLGFLWVVRWGLRRNAVVWNRGAPEAICLLWLGGLALLRVISLHQAGAALATEVFGLRLNWIVELAGIYALVIVLGLRIRTPARRNPDA